MNGLWSVVQKEFTHLRRDPTTLVIALILPLIQMTLFGYAIDFDVRHIPAVVADLDRSAASGDYLEKLTATQYLDIKDYVSSPEEVEARLKSGQDRVGVVIPEGFERTQQAGRHPQVGVLVDGSDAQVAMRARFAFAAPSGPPSPGSPDPRVDVLFNPDSRTATFMIPGLIAVILQIVTVSLTAFSIVREKEQGTLEQLMVSPVGRLALMLGKLIPYATLAMCELVVVLAVSAVVFDVHSSGSVLLLAAMSLPFISASLALGLFISTIAQTQGQALQFTMLTVMPSILLSGYISPQETMPGWLTIISTIVPATHFIAISRGVMVRGAGFGDLLTPFVALLIIAAVLIAASTFRFRKTVG